MADPAAAHPRYRPRLETITVTDQGLSGDCGISHQRYVDGWADFG